jgi:mannose-6-phosphate isomerase-like protein (cupin superfamily)
MRAYIKIIITIIAFTICTLGVIYLSSSRKYSLEKMVVTTPVPKSIKINLEENVFQDVIGHPEARAVKLTLVNLSPAEHRVNESGENSEVMIITLAGEGIVKVNHEHKKTETLNISPRDLAYCPANTAFDIINNNKDPLKYLYVVIGK